MNRQTKSAKNAESQWLKNLVVLDSSLHVQDSLNVITHVQFHWLNVQCLNVTAKSLQEKQKAAEKNSTAVQTIRLVTLFHTLNLLTSTVQNAAGSWLKNMTRRMAHINHVSTLTVTICTL